MLDATVGRLYHLLTPVGGKEPPTYEHRWIQEMVRLLTCHYRWQSTAATIRQHRSLSRTIKMREHVMAVATAMTCAILSLSQTRFFGLPGRWYHPEACLMVGDTVVDILAGKAAGAQTAGVLCGFGEAKELRRAGANIILPQTSMLVEILFPTSGEPLAGGE
jgi:phosphoglycolate phosphatase